MDLDGDDGYCTGADGKGRGGEVDESCVAEEEAEVRVGDEGDIVEVREVHTPGDERYKMEHSSVLRWELVQEHK